MDERQANQVSKGPRWAWDWRWWGSIVGIATVWFLLRWVNGTL